MKIVWWILCISLFLSSMCLFYKFITIFFRSCSEVPKPFYILSAFTIISYVFFYANSLSFRLSAAIFLIISLTTYSTKCSFNLKNHLKLNILLFFRNDLSQLANPGPSNLLLLSQSVDVFLSLNHVLFFLCNCLPCSLKYFIYYWHHHIFFMLWHIYCFSFWNLCALVVILEYLHRLLIIIHQNS